MSVSLSKALVDTAGLSKKEKLRVMKARQSALSLTALELLRRKGYAQGASLKIPGSFAFEATHVGKPVKIGVKTSSDRWVAIPRDGAGGWGVLSAVDEVFVVTFDNRTSPKRLQVLAFDPQLLIAAGQKVYAAAEKAGQTGMQWLPLHHHEGRNATSMAAGHLSPLGKMVADEAIDWSGTDSQEDRQESRRKPVEEEPVPRLSIAEAKAALAATFGVSPEAIKITIEG